jgi:hypothetical protein
MLLKVSISLHGGLLESAIMPWTVHQKEHERNSMDVERVHRATQHSWYQRIESHGHPTSSRLSRRQSGMSPSKYPPLQGKRVVSPLISEHPLLLDLLLRRPPPAAYARAAWVAAVSWWRLGFRKCHSRPSSSLGVDDHPTRRSNG